MESFCWPDLLLICVHTCVIYTDKSKMQIKKIYLVHTCVYLFVWLSALFHSESSDIRKKLWIVHKNQACNLRCIYMRMCVCVRVCHVSVICIQLKVIICQRATVKEFPGILITKTKGKYIATDHNNYNNNSNSHCNNRNNNTTKPLPLLNDNDIERDT